MSVFVKHSVQSAPAASRPAMTAVRDQLGFLPSATALWASSPELLKGFGTLNRLYESSSLDPLAREVVVMTIAVRNGCAVCVALHTKRLRSLDADDAVIAALRSAAPVPSSRLEAVRAFTIRLLDTAGDAGDLALRDFLDAGFTPRNALEVVLGVGTYTMSTFANRLTGADIDEPLRGYALASDGAGGSAHAPGLAD